MNKIKNIAIIAHVDHGKTTLVDELLKSSGTFRANENVDERVMDSNSLEKERGITILAKNTAISHQGYKINILDTPGHSDFSGEVERIMKMVDGVLLVVDAFEGTMPQTRFVLKKALEENLKVMVVVNKIDRPNARIAEVEDEILELFFELGATEEQLDFDVVYASAINGQSGRTMAEIEDTMVPILDAVVDNIPDADNVADADFRFQVSLLDYNDYVGRIGIGRVFEGTVKSGQEVSLCRNDGSIEKFRITKLYSFMGLNRVEVEEAVAGDIIAVVGKADINVGESVCQVGKEAPLPAISIDEPTLQMDFIVNDSPFAGTEGKFVTASTIEERLFLETQTDVSLRVEKTDSPSVFRVVGRGELHLSILIENMRREGFELQVAKPQVVIKEINGVMSEPVELVQIDVPAEYVGAIMESLGNRKAEFTDMKPLDGGQSRLFFEAYSRSLIGYNTELTNITKGYGIYNHTFLKFAPVANFELKTRNNGVLVANDKGKATAYALMSLEDRGVIFIEPGTEVYSGMIIGEHSKANDLTVNAVKAKQKTNVRSANKDSTVVLSKPRTLSMEQQIEYLEDDEYLEVTPVNTRLRKALLDEGARARAARDRKWQKENAE